MLLHVILRINIDYGRLGLYLNQSCSLSLPEVSPQQYPLLWNQIIVLYI